MNVESKATEKVSSKVSKIPPQAAIPRAPLAAPSVLHLIEEKIGGCQWTSFMLGARLGCPGMPKLCKMKSSSTNENMVPVDCP